MELFVQQTVNAISLGGVYAMLALGLAIVFSIVRLINFAHGEIMTFGAYGIFLALAFGLPPAAALLFGLAAAVSVFLRSIGLTGAAERLLMSLREGSSTVEIHLSLARSEFRIQ